jgi:glucokinase
VVDTTPTVPGLSGVELRAELARRTGLAPRAIQVENDANAAAAGEAWLGAARGERHALVVTLGTGIGGGLILDGRPFSGEGLGGEVGHLVVDPQGPPCGCGSRGCLEALASANAARRRARERGLPAADPGNLELLVERARAPGAERELLLEIGRDLGRGLAAVVTLLDVRLFVFGGGFSAAFERLEAGIQEGLAERSFGERGVRLRKAALGPAAGWIGAAHLTASA